MVVRVLEREVVEYERGWGVVLVPDAGGIMMRRVHTGRGRFLCMRTF